MSHSWKHGGSLTTSCLEAWAIDLPIRRSNATLILLSRPSSLGISSHGVTISQFAYLLRCIV